MITNKLSTKADRTDVIKNTQNVPHIKTANIGRKHNTAIIECTTSYWHMAPAISSGVCSFRSNSSGAKDGITAFHFFYP